MKVYTYKRKNRNFWTLEWKDPVTGKPKTRTTKTTKENEAHRLAALLEAELTAGRSIDPSRVTWSELWDHYKAANFPRLAKASQRKTTGTFNAVTRIINPNLVAALNSRQILKFQAALRAKNLAEFSVKSHLAELQKILRWGERNGMVHNPPRIELPRRLRAMKGRPITGEEFDRMIVATPGVVGEPAAASWCELLRGLYWSGLRLAEALTLHWTADTGLTVDLKGRRPMLFIRAQAEKGRKDRYLPMAPEFAQMLTAVPAKERKGYVFNPLPGPDWTGGRLSMLWVSKRICAIGKAAKVKVSERTKGKSTHAKWASAHDLRRAFGFRWSQRVLPPVLQELMRHESIQTTMDFYAGRHAETAADAAWSAFEGGLSVIPSVKVTSEGPKNP